MTAEWIGQWPPETFMRLHCEFSTPVARTDLDDYIRHLEISVGCYDEDGLKEYVVGKLAVDQILWMNAIVDGVSLFDICDNDSQGLHEVHTILTKGKQEFRPDLKIKEVTSHVMFLYGAVFHPSIHAYRQGILDAALNLFGEESPDRLRQMQEVRRAKMVRPTEEQSQVELLFPAIAQWVRGYGHIEIGEQEMFGFVARALDYGNLAFEDDRPDTLAEALAALERGLRKWYEDQGIEVG